MYLSQIFTNNVFGGIAYLCFYFKGLYTLKCLLSRLKFKNAH